MQLSRKVQGVSASPTLALDAKAKQMKAEGADVMNLTAGEPDFDTPDNVKQAAIDAIKAGFTKYTPVPGIPELRQAIADKLKRDNGLEYSPDEIIVSCGGKHSLYNTFQAVCNPRDEVIIPTPCWVSYPEMVKLADAKPVLVETREENGFGLLAKDVEDKVTKKTKVILLNSPNNPTGAVIAREELNKIASIAVENDVFVISDEIYEYLIYEGEHVSIAGLGKEIKDRTIISNGASKSYSMTGWRIGWTAGPPDVIKAMTRLQSHSTSNPAGIAQKAYLAGILSGTGFVTKMRDEFVRRRDFMVKRLNGIGGVSCILPKGSFYTFPNIKAPMKKGGFTSDMDFAVQLIDESKVAVVPGSAFGAPGYLRLSYATSMDTIREALDRLEAFVKKS